MINGNQKNWIMSENNLFKISFCEKSLVLMISMPVASKNTKLKLQMQL